MKTRLRLNTGLKHAPDDTTREIIKLLRKLHKSQEELKSIINNEHNNEIHNDTNREN